MRPALLLVLLMMAAAAPAAAQSCATLGGGLDCGASPSRPAIKPPRPAPAPAGEQAQTERTFETTVSNHGVSTTLKNTVTDSHGVMEFGFSGATGTPCRVPGYGAACQ
jgi:hypothetical protein